MIADTPEDQPIRRGDVVQVIGRIFRGIVVVVTDVADDEIRAGNFCFLPKHAVRIGRARFYPDGSPVEP